ncbi:pleckstrin homology domain-containing protein [Cryptosporidium canis]|uniref:Pleckstrin homology domain-containing protein n=1 Tax=Cryptosporidium canis TaxID=195482 RepID=A0A9D5HXZ5_9CRYT|nr:pleckstrin homology domain-containing protein [Cryptosporidium canis]
MGEHYHPSNLKIDYMERSASMVQELIENEYVSGYLRKWSPVIGRGWQNRYFSLLEQDKTLVYWAKKPSFKDEQPLGSINLKIVENVFADGPLGITLSTPHRDYQLRASTPTEKDKWMDAIILWTLKSRRYRSRAEDSKNFRFSNMLIEATQSCLHYIVESFLKPFKKSATRAIEVGPETLSNSNKKKFLKDRGLYNVICKAWMISRELKGERVNSMMKGRFGYMVDGLETRAASTLSIDKDYQQSDKLSHMESEDHRHHASGQAQQLYEDSQLGNAAQSHPRFGVSSSALSLESENNPDSEVSYSLAEFEDVSMGCDTEEILIPFDSAISIYDFNCPPTIEEDEEYVRSKQHKYSLQLSELMLNQLSSLSKEAFLDNCIFGLVYIKRNNPIIPSLQSNDIFWALMISSRSLSDSHQIYPSPILSEKTIIGDCLNLYREVRLSSSKQSVASCSKYSCNNSQSRSQSNRDSIPVLGAIQIAQISKSSIEGTLGIDDKDIKSKVKFIDHKTQIDGSTFSPIGNNFLNNLALNIGSGGMQFGMSSNAIDPYGFLLDTLYLYYPRNESKNPVHMLDPGLILSAGPISESIHGFSFTVSYLGSIVTEDHVASELEFNCDSPSDIPYIAGTSHTPSSEKQPITLEICTRSWRDARAWRYSLLVARKSKMADYSHGQPATRICQPESKFSCKESKAVHVYETCNKGSNYHCFDSCPTLTTTASSSARTSHGYHLTNYRRNISNFALHR